MKAWLRLAVIGSTAVVGSWVCPYSADACTCVSYTNQTAEQARERIEASFDRAAAVFSGHVESVDRLGAVVRVEKVWKGALGPKVKMRHATLSPAGSMSISSCDVTFTQGYEYLVFGMRASADVMYAERCGPTGLLEPWGETMRVLATIVSVRQGGEPDAYARFLTLEQSWMKALSARDMSALEALLAPDFTIIGLGSIAVAPVVGRTEWLINAARFPWPDHEVRLVKVHEKGDLAVVHCVLRATYPPKSITPKGGALEFLVTDVWVKRGAAWHVLSRHASLADR